jgi:hypothetical protein
MYVIEISSINGEEAWYSGAGWYWTDQNFNLHGAYATEKECVTDYAWHVHAVLEQVNETPQIQLLSCRKH